MRFAQPLVCHPLTWQAQPLRIRCGVRPPRALALPDMARQVPTETDVLAPALTGPAGAAGAHRGGLPAGTGCGGGGAAAAGAGGEAAPAGCPAPVAGSLNVVRRGSSAMPAWAEVGRRAAALRPAGFKPGRAHPLPSPQAPRHPATSRTGAAAAPGGALRLHQALHAGQPAARPRQPGAAPDLAATAAARGRHRPGGGRRAGAAAAAGPRGAAGAPSPLRVPSAPLPAPLLYRRGTTLPLQRLPAALPSWCCASLQPVTSPPTHPPGPRSRRPTCSACAPCWAPLPTSTPWW